MVNDYDYVRQRNWGFATNFFITSILLQSDGVNLWHFKYRLFDDISNIDYLM